MHRFEILTKTQVEKIHATSLRILEHIGLDFGYPPTLEVLKKGGAKVDGQRVFFPDDADDNIRPIEAKPIGRYAYRTTFLSGDR